MRSSMVDLRQTYLKCLDELEGDIDGRLSAQKYLMGSTAIYHDDVIGVGYVPKIYDMMALRFMDDVVNKTYKILEKVTRRFLDDAEYRELFGFSPILEKLICLPTGYASVIPIMRMDIFLDEENLDFGFCEFNTDGTSAMNEDRETGLALTKTNVFQNLENKLKLERQELFDGWIREFLNIYQSFEQAIDNPTIAIIDFTASSTIYEFLEFQRRFKEQGHRCIVCDVADLVCKDGFLYAQINADNDIGLTIGAGTNAIPVENAAAEIAFVRIDAIYRRAVTGEVVTALEQDSTPNRGANALVSAVTDKAVCMIGGFVTHVAHCKQLFAVLHNPMTAHFLDKEEIDFIQKHIPFTAILGESHIDIDTIKKNKDQWILKPEDGYASKGVHAGCDKDLATWEKLVDECSKQRYIVQKYCKQYASTNSRLVPVNKDGQPKYVDRDSWLAGDLADNPKFLDGWNNLTGMYVYNGKFSGLFVRAGRAGIIAGFAGGLTLASLLSNYDQDSGLAVRTA